MTNVINFLSKFLYISPTVNYGFGLNMTFFTCYPIYKQRILFSRGVWRLTVSS